LYNLFIYFDTDGNGIIRKEELQIAYQKYNIDITDEIIEKIINSSDLNNNHALDISGN
jgi:Ca2+-binding EF-hand superfamily protein